MILRADRVVFFRCKTYAGRRGGRRLGTARRDGSRAVVVAVVLRRQARRRQASGRVFVRAVSPGLDEVVPVLERIGIASVRAIDAGGALDPSLSVGGSSRWTASAWPPRWARPREGRPRDAPARAQPRVAPVPEQLADLDGARRLARGRHRVFRLEHSRRDRRVRQPRHLAGRSRIGRAPARRPGPARGGRRQGSARVRSRRRCRSRPTRPTTSSCGAVCRGRACSTRSSASLPTRCA